MAETSYEFAVFGSTPLARLVAGLLATTHRKRVCLVGERPSAFRLVRGIDLSVMAVTRPETWALLRDGIPETQSLLTRLGARQGMRRTEPIFVAETPAGAEALAHASQVAHGFGRQVERLESGRVAAGIAYRWRDALLLNRPVLLPVLARWLEAVGVGQLAAGDVAVTLRRDGSARIDKGAATFDADHAVLADDAAILTYLDGAERGGSLLTENATALLTEPAQSMAAPAMVYVDRLVRLVRNRDGSIAALGAGNANDATSRIGGCLADQRYLRRAGQASFQTLATLDGAPLVGLAKGIRATVIAGLGDAGVFFAPSVARMLARVADGPERAYFTARESGRGSARAQVADYQSPLVLEAQF